MAINGHKAKYSVTLFIYYIIINADKYSLRLATRTRSILHLIMPLPVSIVHYVLLQNCHSEALMSIPSLGCA